jgi:hypothetical protein
VFLSGILVVLVGLALARGAAAQDRDEVYREAAKHFQRGVTLYGEADYGGALVEFKRAAELAPNPTVLFNIGQTEYQLRDYAGALRTFERYLAEAGPTAANRSEVENAVKVLRSRVGRLTITTDPMGADVSVDDVPVGKTPFNKAVLVGVGRIKVVASILGRAPVTRYVDVAADDDVAVAMTLVADATPGAPPQEVVTPVPRLEDKAPQPATGGGSGWRTLGWAITGVSAAGAVAFGVLAKKESNDLQTARNTYPATTANLNHLANRTTTYAVVADSLAAVALVAAGVTLYSTLSGGGSDAHNQPGTRVSVGLGSLQLETTF